MGKSRSPPCGMPKKKTFIVSEVLVLIPHHYGKRPVSSKQTTQLSGSQDVSVSVFPILLVQHRKIAGSNSKDFLDGGEAHGGLPPAVAS